MSKIFCDGFQRVPLKFRIKYFAPYIERCDYYAVESTRAHNGYHFLNAPKICNSQKTPHNLPS